MDLANSPLSIFILISTIAISLYALYGKSNLMNLWVMHPWSMINRNRWYTIITSGFLHADMPHLMFNMLTFYFFAFKLEYIIGSWRFALIYFGSMILSDVTTIIKQRENYEYRSLGASGAISGVLFSYILFAPRERIGVFLLPIGIPAPIFGVLYLAYCYWASKRSYDNVNHEAHLWGALAGIIITVILIPPVIDYFFMQVF